MHIMGAGYPWRFGLYFITYYLTTSVYNNFMGVYFNSLNLTTTHISMLMAAIPLVSIFAQPMWGSLGDRMKSKRLLMCLLSAGSMCLMLMFRLNDSFPYLLLMMALFSALFPAIQPLGDSIVFEALMEGRRPFGPLRLMGCLGFALSSLLVGRFLEGRINWTIYLTAIYLSLLAMSSWALPVISGHQKGKGKSSMGFFSLLRDENLRNLLIFVTLLQITLGYFYSFFSVHFVNLPGGTSGLLGTCYLISALSEVPFLLFSDKLFDRFGAGKLLCISAAVLTVRWLILGLTNNVMVVMASQVLHSWCFVVLTVSVSKYISLTVPEELRSRGQMLLAVLGFGIARMVGSLGGGALANAMGMQHGFFVPSAIAAAALVYFGPKYIKAPPLNGSAEQMWRPNREARGDS